MFRNTTSTTAQKLFKAIKEYKESLSTLKFIQANQERMTSYTFGPHYSTNYMHKETVHNVNKQFQIISKYFSIIECIDLSGINQEDLLFVIQQFNASKQFELLLKALDGETNLGSRFLKLTPDDKLIKQIYLRIKELKPDFDLDAYIASIRQNEVTHSMHNEL